MNGLKALLLLFLGQFSAFLLALPLRAYCSKTGNGDDQVIAYDARKKTAKSAIRCWVTRV